MDLWTIRPLTTTTTSSLSTTIYNVTSIVNATTIYNYTTIYNATNNYNYAVVFPRPKSTLLGIRHLPIWHKLAPL